MKFEDMSHEQKQALMNELVGGLKDRLKEVNLCAVLLVADLSDEETDGRGSVLKSIHAASNLSPEDRNALIVAAGKVFGGQKPDRTRRWWEKPR